MIAETTDLPTKYRQDRRHRRSGPLRACPICRRPITTSGCAATGSSIRRRSQASRARSLNLTAVPAPNAAAAAQYYPAIYWYSMLKIPDESEFPAPDRRQRHAAKIKSQGAVARHRQDQRLRRLPPARQQGDAHDPARRSAHFDNSARGLGAAHPVRPGGDQHGQHASAASTPQRALEDVRRLDRPHRRRRTAVRASRSGRRASSATSSHACGTGADPTAYLHDEISTDRRNPTVNANGKIYGSTEDSTDFIPVLDPVHNTASEMQASGARSEDADTRRTLPMAPSPYWGDEPIWDSQTIMHNPMIDEKGRVWFTARIRPPANPDFCKQGSDHPSAKVFPLKAVEPPAVDVRSEDRQVHADQHLLPDASSEFRRRRQQHAVDQRRRRRQRRCVGWLNRKMFEETGDEQKSQGWTPFILDTNGNGKRDDYVEPNQPVDPTKDKRIVVGLYAVAVKPGRRHDLGHRRSAIPGYVVRVDPGPDPTAHRADRNLRAAVARLRRRAAATSTATASFWASLASGHLASFDRRKCKVAQRPDRDRQALPGRLDALSRSRDRSSQASPSPAAPRRATTPGSTSTTRSASARTCRSPPATSTSRIAGAGRRQVRQPARALSDGLLRQGHGRPHRRSERRLEGPGAVVDLRHPDAVPPRRRQGNVAEGREIPASARSAGAMRQTQQRRA